MDMVARPVDSVLYGKYPCMDRDGKVRHPVGMESFVLKRAHCPEQPLVIPVQLAVTWTDDLIQVMDKQKMLAEDFLLVTPPKAGTHWTWETMSMLARGQAQYSEEPKHLSWCEFQKFPEIISKHRGEPRVLNTHLTLSQLSPNFRQTNTKVVACMRNPKDVLVSLYYHFRLVGPRTNGQYLSFDSMFDYLLYSKYVPFGKTLDHYADTWDNHRNDPNVLIIFYEDLKENTETVVRVIAEHMKVKHDSQLIKAVTSAIDIKVMKQGKHQSEKVFRGRYGQDASLFRKGEIGDWKTHFSAEQNKKFEKVYKKWNRDRAIPFRFEPSTGLRP